MSCVNLLLLKLLILWIPGFGMTMFYAARGLEGSSFMAKHVHANLNAMIWVEDGLIFQPVDCK